MTLSVPCHTNYIVAVMPCGERLRVQAIEDCTNAKFMLGNFKRRYKRATGGAYFRIESLLRKADILELPAFYDRFGDESLSTDPSAPENTPRRAKVFAATTKAAKPAGYALRALWSGIGVIVSAGALAFGAILAVVWVLNAFCNAVAPRD